MASEFPMEVLRNRESVNRVMNGRTRTNFVTRVVRVDGDGCITQHGLGTGCRNNDFLVCANIRNHLMQSFYRDLPDPSMGYANDVITPNSNFSFAS